MRIVFIDIDSCRPDHLGCYGYHRKTSPHIDRIAQEGVVFHECYVSDAPCMPSRTALYSGRFGFQTGVVGHGGTAAKPRGEGASRGFRDSFGETGLASCLQLRGLHTAMISPFGQRHSAHWIYAGFNEIYNTGRNGEESAEEVWPAVSDWLDRNLRRDDWFLHINFWDPHTPYRTPAGFGDPFVGDPLPAWLEDETVLQRHLQHTGPHSAWEINMYDDTERADFPRQPGRVTDRAGLRRLINGYDTGIRFVDEQIGALVSRLQAAGVYEETAIIISADHGENLGEFGIYADHTTADRATCRVPMIVRWPGGKQGTDHDLRYQFDLAPTLMDLLGADAPAAWDGISFAGCLRSGMAPSARRDSVVFSQGAHVCQRAVRWDRWLYLRTYHDGFHLFPAEMLFDLQADPHEEHDLASLHPEQVREGAWRLARWRDAQLQRLADLGTDVTDPMWTVIAEGGPFHARLRAPGRPGSVEGLRAYLKRLEQTGRQVGADALRQRYARVLQGGCRP